uniref:Uncharacterized protein n=1 Tax=Panagrolaimus sp. JU765 TaxID=591449 RepID=A0AC34R454_9BILA
MTIMVDEIDCPNGYYFSERKQLSMQYFDSGEEHDDDDEPSPTINFNKIDDVLKRRFYTLNRPFVRKGLHLSSKTTANWGPKPKTLIVKQLCHYENDFSAPILEIEKYIKQT